MCLGRRLFGVVLLNGCMGSGALAAVAEAFVGMGRGVASLGVSGRPRGMAGEGVGLVRRPGKVTGGRRNAAEVSEGGVSGKGVGAEMTPWQRSYSALVASGWLGVVS